jgi:hypothetical protein
MARNLNLEEVRNKFIELERKYLVFDLNYKGIYYWKLIRMDLYNQIINMKGFVKESHPLSRKDKVNRFLKLLKYSSINFWKRLKLRQCDTVLLTHGRKSFINGKFEDIYLYDFINNLKEAKSEYLIIDRPDYYGNHVWKNKNNFIYFERFGHITRELLYPFFLKNIKLDRTIGVIKELEYFLLKDLNINVDLEKLIKKKLFRFNTEKKYFDKLLEKIAPKTIYLLVSYGKEELISSAKERSIKTIEVQHGIINNFHMGYFFPYNFEIPYFPDEVYTFGDFWNESVAFPINCEQLSQNFKYLKPNYIDTSKRSEKKNIVLFISQGPYGDQLSAIAVNFIRNNNVKVYYKLHPSEFSIWRKKYTELASLEADNKVKVITNEIPLNELFNICKYVIGVNSTAIFESLLYECYTFILKIEGHQYMDYLIKNNYVKLITKDFSFSELLNNETKVLEDKSFFYK